MASTYLARFGADMTCAQIHAPLQFKIKNRHPTNLRNPHTILNRMRHMNGYDEFPLPSEFRIGR
jgi:hypothetical protein